MDWCHPADSDLAGARLKRGDLKMTYDSNTDTLYLNLVENLLLFVYIVYALYEILF